jgi:FKBP-type peptidyl-prolyl cis-trans isomerase
MNLTKYHIYSILAFLILAVSSCEKDYESIEVLDEKNIQEYLDKNDLNMTAFGNTGIYYSEIKAPTGSDLAYNQEVPLIYTIRSLDGKNTALDTFTNRYSDFLGYLGPEGFRIGVKDILKKSDGEIRLIIPSKLAYGRNGNGVVPGNTSVDVNIKVIDLASLPQYDESVISLYMKSNNLTGFTRTSSGLYYKIADPGTGDPILPDSELTAQYTAKLFNGTEIYSSDSYRFYLDDLIKGWKEGLPLIKGGGSIRLLVPSGLAYGLKGSGPVTPFSCLDFDIKVVSVIK